MPPPCGPWYFPPRRRPRSLGSLEVTLQLTQIACKRPSQGPSIAPSGAGAAATCRTVVLVSSTTLPRCRPVLTETDSNIVAARGKRHGELPRLTLVSSHAPKWILASGQGAPKPKQTRALGREPVEGKRNTPTDEMLSTCAYSAGLDAIRRARILGCRAHLRSLCLASCRQGMPASRKSSAALSRSNKLGSSSAGATS